MQPIALRQNDHVATDARSVTAGSTLTADVCIVGGGPAGITIARRLASSSLRVLLVESGGTEFDEETNDLNRGDLVGEDMTLNGNERPLHQTRLRFFGGSTNHWFGWCRPLDPWDFTERRSVPNSGWPITRSELEPYFAEVAELCELGPAVFAPAEWADRFGAPGPLPSTDRIATTMFQISPPTRFGERFLGELEAAATVEILLWGNVTELHTTADGGRVTGATVRTLSGNEFSVQAEAFVLATGGVEVPRILLASAGAHPAGIGNGHDIVGRYFMEHPHLTVGAVLLDVQPDDLGLYGFGRYEVPAPLGGGNREVTAIGVVQPTAAAQQELEILNMTAWFRVRALEEIEAELGGDEAVATPPQVAALVAAISGRRPPAVATMLTMSEQLPTADSRVMLGSEVDALGMPRVRLDWRHSELDRNTVQRGLEVIGSELGALGLGRVQVEAPHGGPWDQPLGVGSHHMGTARMSVDPTRGVVDPDCRVHGVENLWVAGSAVYPTAGCANPTFTLLALALRLADHLATEVLT
jgi:choline dehydrogenase-like flavoprotein